MAAFHRHEFPWPALPFTVGLSSVDIYVTALRRLYWKILMATIFCVLWMVMRLSWPSLICLLLSVSLTIFSFTDFNLSTAFPASSFRGLNLDLLVRSHCDCQQEEFKSCSSWSYPLHFLLCSSLLFDWNTLCPNQSFADDTQLLQSCLFWSDAHTPVLTMQRAYLKWRPGWHKANWNWETTRQRLSWWSLIESFFLDTQPTSLRGHIAEIPFTNCVRNLGFMISDDMSLDNHISSVCCPAYVEIRRVSYIRHYLLKQRELSSIIWSTVCHSFFPGSSLAYPSDLCSGDTHPPLKFLAKAFPHSNGIIFLKSDVFSPPVCSKLR